ncbi:hypothetical protein F2Q69_00020076 [Brassica cretica]|uniref:Uncharacterized protein n=1 Tax=Brassica cretica TaxID=69181 RepID=A0A8S9QEZ5_BRACR|nr:hypothetical protein F2Q69_00020076 [Brassica cretica]
MSRLCLYTPPRSAEFPFTTDLYLPFPSTLAQFSGFELLLPGNIPVYLFVFYSPLQPETGERHCTYEFDSLFLNFLILIADDLHHYGACVPSPEPLKPPLKSSIFALSSSPPSSALPDLWKKIVHGGSGSGAKARSWRGRRGSAFCGLLVSFPGGGGSVSSVDAGSGPREVEATLGSVVVGLDYGSVVEVGGFGLVVTTSEDDRSWTKVNGDGSRKVFLSVIATNGDG